MRNSLIKLLSLLLAMALLVGSLTGCDIINGWFMSEDGDGDGDEDDKPKDPSEIQTLNGVSLEDYVIVYNHNGPDYDKRAAEYISNAIYDITGVDIPAIDQGADRREHEIVVGETNRAISATLNEECEGVEFAILADGGHIALEAEYFVIAAAAYYFVYTYITDKAVDITVPDYPVIHEPIVEEANSFIILIGDGMGEYQTRLFENFDVATEGDLAYSDGEDIFYGYMLPYFGYSRTNSLTGTTDSAAGGTALATGYKTYNQMIGRDKDGNDVMSLTELCGSMGMATAVMSTEKKSGATPGAFSAHAFDRDDTEDIVASQIQTTQNYGTIVNCSYNYYTAAKMSFIESKITDTLNIVSKDEDGFFLMYEEAHIDKHSHNNDMDLAFNSLVRFNQAIGRFMEFCFYNPDTMLLITADHETGGLHIDEEGEWKYASDSHTSASVPVFAWGYGAEVFDGREIENVQIPKTIAAMLGVNDFGDATSNYPALSN